MRLEIKTFNTIGNYSDFALSLASMSSLQMEGVFFFNVIVKYPFNDNLLFFYLEPFTGIIKSEEVCLNNYKRLLVSIVKQG